MLIPAIFQGGLTLISLALGHLTSLKRTNSVPPLDGYFGFNFPLVDKHQISDHSRE